MGRLLCETTQSLTELPQLLCCSVILSFSIDFSHGAVGEVTPTERFKPLLESTVQGGLGSLDGVFEEKNGQGLQENSHY